MMTANDRIEALYYYLSQCVAIFTYVLASPKYVLFEFKMFYLFE